MAWYSELDESLHPALKNFADVGALAKSYMETKSLVGSSIRPPGKDAGAEDIAKFNASIMEKAPQLMIRPDTQNKEQMDAFYSMAGRPKEAGSYKADMPDGMFVDGVKLSAFQKLAFEVGLSDSQYKSVVENIYANDMNEQSLQAEAYNQGVMDLKKDWGSAYDTKVDDAINISNKYFGNKYTRDDIPTDFLKGLAEVANQFGKEDLNAIKPEARVIMTTNEANSQIAEIYANKEHAFFDSSNPQHAVAVNRVVELKKLANPE